MPCESNQRFAMRQSPHHVVTYILIFSWVAVEWDTDNSLMDRLSEILASNNVNRYPPGIIPATLQCGRVRSRAVAVSPALLIQEISAGVRPAGLLMRSSSRSRN